LQEKPFQLLALLLEHPGELISRDELRDRLWEADTFVDFNQGLNTAVKKLRQALGIRLSIRVILRHSLGGDTGLLERWKRTRPRVNPPRARNFRLSR
jgi:DNA-binding winged helix-turn-helix (wHTH) protein